MNIEAGSIVGDYQVVGVLGAGGMGKVFKVRSTISNRLEAMKILLPDLAGEPELADRFLREIQVLARLEHPNIAGLRTALRFENQLLMVMELVEGVPLDQRLREGPLPVGEAVRCIDQVLAALAFAHQSGVIHRDIKPANMMVMADGTVKLMDFGIAKAAGDRKLTMTGGTMGSVYYMSPEQINGAESVDARSDLYSVGVSLYELVTGKHAFDGDSQFAILSAHLEKAPVPPITIDPKLPRALNDLIMLSVAREADRRFQTADAFRNALKSVAEATIAATVATVTLPAAPPRPMAAAAPGVPAEPKSRRALWATLGALCFVVVLVGAIQFGPWKKAVANSEPPKAAAQPQQQITISPAPPPSAPPAEVPPPVASPAAGNGGAVRMPAPAMLRAREATAPASPAGSPSGTAPVQQQPTPQQAAAPVSAAPSQAEDAAQRKELQKVRESLALLSARAGAIRSTLQNMQRSQAATGLGMRSDWVQSAALMDTFLQGSHDALAAGDSAAAKDFLEKGERQVERLEKALNK